jgi:hypothetical protein
MSLALHPNQPRIVHDPLKYLYCRTLQDTLQCLTFKVKLVQIIKLVNCHHNLRFASLYEGLSNHMEEP